MDVGGTEGTDVLVLTIRRDWFDETRPTKEGPIALFVAISIQFPLWMFPLYFLCILCIFNVRQEFLPFCLYLFPTKIIETSLSIIVHLRRQLWDTCEIGMLRMLQASLWNPRCNVKSIP